MTNAKNGINMPRKLNIPNAPSRMVATPERIAAIITTAGNLRAFHVQKAILGN
jgi:hypothetical protein